LCTALLSTLRKVTSSFHAIKRGGVRQWRVATQAAERLWATSCFTLFSNSQIMSLIENATRFMRSLKEPPVDHSLDGTNLTRMVPFTGQPSEHFTRFTQQELTAWGKNLGTGISERPLESQTQRDAEKERWMENAEPDSPISPSRATEMVDYCWHDVVSRLPAGAYVRQYADRQVHIGRNGWSDNKHFDMLPQNARQRHVFRADSGYMAPDIPSPSEFPMSGLSRPVRSEVSQVSARSSIMHRS